MLLKQDGMMLTSKRVIQPPRRYFVRIFLRKMVEPEEYYKEPYQVKEFIGQHTLNQLGAQFNEANATPAYSQPLAAGETEGEALPDSRESGPVGDSEQIGEDLMKVEQEEQFTRMPSKEAPVAETEKK